jgi:hypothetical protein
MTPERAQGNPPSAGAAVPAQGEGSGPPDLQARLVQRSIPVLAAMASQILVGPRVLTVALVLISLAVSGLLVFRSMDTTTTDRALVVTGSALVGLVLLGLLLALVPAGLTSQSWVLGVALGELVIIFATLRVPLPVPARRWSGVMRTRGLGWYVAGVVVLVAAFGLSAGSTIHADAAPLAISVQAEQGTQYSVAVTSGRVRGPLTVVETSSGGRRVLRSGVVVGPGNSTVVALEPGITGQVKVGLEEHTAEGSSTLAHLTFIIP